MNLCNRSLEVRWKQEGGAEELLHLAKDPNEGPKKKWTASSDVDGIVQLTAKEEGGAHFIYRKFFAYCWAGKIEEVETTSRPESDPTSRPKTRNHYLTKALLTGMFIRYTVVRGVPILVGTPRTLVHWAPGGSSRCTNNN